MRAVTSRKLCFAGLMAATFCLWGMTIPASAESTKDEPARQRSSASGGASGGEGAWVRDPRFTYLKMGYCARIYRCVAPDKVQPGARHFTVSSPKMQAGLCRSGVDSADYCGLCQTDEPKQPCTYNLK